MLPFLVVAAIAACPVSEIKPAHILELPSEDEISQAYPIAASKVGQEGGVKLSCDVDAKGVLSACRIDSEDPAGWGFGAAAVSVFNRIIVAPKKECGKSVPGTFSTGFRFRMWAPPVSDQARTASTKAPPSPEALTLARRLMAAEHIPDDLDSNYALELEHAATQDPQAPSEYRLAAYEIGKSIAEREREHILDGVATNYAQNFPIADLRAWVSFVESPEGRRFMDRNRRKDARPVWLDFERFSVEARARFCAQTRSCAAVTPVSEP